MKILVCDDASFMRMVLVNIIKESGHEVVGEAVNGADAFDKYKSIKPDAVTMDITMPDVDGIEGVKRIMAFDSNAKIVMCSAMGQKAMVMDAMKAGAKDFIVKPFDSVRVAEALSKLFN